MKNVSFSPNDFKQFKKIYGDAIKTGKESFIFKGDEYLTAYAKYLIEYLNTKLR